MYFGDYFVLGGDRYPALDPEAFLFGDMAELDFLSRPPGTVSRIAEEKLRRRPDKEVCIQIQAFLCTFTHNAILGGEGKI